MIAPEILAGWGCTGVIFIGHIFVANYRLGKNEANVDEVWKWKTKHEEEVSKKREEFQKELSELKGAQLVVGEQFRQIMSALTEIKDRLSDLENNRNN